MSGKEADAEVDDRDNVTCNRPDFWVGEQTTSNKRLNFLQHIGTQLTDTGRTAVIVPDNVLYECAPGSVGDLVCRELLTSAVTVKSHVSNLTTRTASLNRVRLGVCWRLGKASPAPEAPPAPAGRGRCTAGPGASSGLLGGQGRQGGPVAARRAIAVPSVFRFNA